MTMGMAWLILVVASLLAAIAAMIDGALLAGAPSLQVSDREPNTGLKNVQLPERERLHRALAFFRLSTHAIAGCVIVYAIEGTGRTAGALILLLTALVCVILTEATARLAGEILGEKIEPKFQFFSSMFLFLVSPIVRLSERVDALVLTLFPVSTVPAERRDEAAEQFRQVVATQPRVSHAARDLLHGVFEFGDTVVSDVMVPRVDIIALDRDVPWNEVVDRVRVSHHSRLPVYVDTVDEIVGILYAKDLLSWILRQEEPEGGWESLVRPASYIPSTRRIADQLRDFRTSRSHMAIVADEYGGTEGIVTIEDILEVLVGDIRDEYDEGETSLIEERDGRWWVSGRTTLDDLSEVLDTDFTNEQVSTLGGLILESLGRVPRAGEVVEISGYRMVVERVIRRKVERVFLEKANRDLSGEQ